MELGPGFKLYKHFLIVN